MIALRHECKLSTEPDGEMFSLLCLLLFMLYALSWLFCCQLPLGSVALTTWYSRVATAEIIYFWLWLHFCPTPAPAIYCYFKKLKIITVTGS